MSRRTFDALVYFLGAALLLCVVGIILLLILQRPVDDILKQVATGLVTGLLGVMVRGPQSDDPQPVYNVDTPVPIVEV